MNRIINPMLLVFCILVLFLVVTSTQADKHRQPVPTAPESTPSESDVQAWQGRVVRAANGQMTIKIEGELERFPVDNDAAIVKDRRPAELESLHRGDFANVRTVGRGDAETVISIRAFSLR